MDKIQQAAVLLWDQHHMKDTSKAPQANKVSTAKCKGMTPNLSNNRCHKVMAQKRSESAVSVLARSKRRRSQKTLPSTLTPTSLQSPIPLVLSCPWIPTSLPINLYQCTKKNKVLSSSCHLPFLPHCPHPSPMPSHPPPLSCWTVHHHSSHGLSQSTS